MVVLANEFKLTSVDGSNVEYIGYIEMDIEVDVRNSQAGFLVIKGKPVPISEWRCERWRNLVALYE